MSYENWKTCPCCGDIVSDLRKHMRLRDIIDNNDAVHKDVTRCSYSHAKRCKGRCMRWAKDEVRRKRLFGTRKHR